MLLFFVTVLLTFGWTVVLWNMVRGRYSFEEMERLFTSCIGETAMAEKLQAEPCVRTAGHFVGKGGHEYSSKGAFQGGNESNGQNSKGTFSSD